MKPGTAGLHCFRIATIGTSSPSREIKDESRGVMYVEHASRQAFSSTVMTPFRLSSATSLPLFRYRASEYRGEGRATSRAEVAHLEAAPHYQEHLQLRPRMTSRAYLASLDPPLLSNLTVMSSSSVCMRVITMTKMLFLTALHSRCHALSRSMSRGV